MNIFKNILLIISVLFLFSACKVQKVNMNILNDMRDSTHNRIWQDYETKIQPGDKLTIGIIALNPASVQPYALGPEGTPGIVQVENDGRILYPQLGYIKAAGLTRQQLKDLLQEKLKVYLSDPVVTIDFTNFKVTMLGEVKNQGVINVVDGKISILEAIGLSGDLTLDGRRDSILVIREVNGKREFGNINLHSNEVFKSPYFILQQNDVVYVPMIKSKANVSVKGTNGIQIGTVYTLVGILSTLVILITQLSRI